VTDITLGSIHAAMNNVFHLFDPVAELPTLYHPVSICPPTFSRFAAIAR
jgi:hypothetical protein